MAATAFSFPARDEKHVLGDFGQRASGFVGDADGERALRLGLFQNHVGVGRFARLGDGDHHGVAVIDLGLVESGMEGAASETGMPVVISIR